MSAPLATLADPAQSSLPVFLVEAGPVVRDTVLVVEDDAPVAALLGHILARIDRRVLHARDGGECLRLFEQHAAAIGLVFMDCTLPDAHGGTLCDRLRSIVPGLPVLLTSGRQQPGLLKLLAADGPTAFLSKPYLPAEVLRQVRLLLPTRGRDTER